MNDSVNLDRFKIIESKSKVKLKNIEDENHFMDKSKNPMYFKNDYPLFMKIKLKVPSFHNIKQSSEYIRDKAKSTDFNIQKLPPILNCKANISILNEFKYKHLSKIENSQNKIKKYTSQISISSSKVKDNKIQNIDNQDKKNPNLDESSIQIPIKTKIKNKLGTILKFKIIKQIKHVVGSYSGTSSMVIKDENHFNSQAFIKFNMMICDNFNVFGIVEGFGKEASTISHEAKLNITEFFSSHKNLVVENSKFNIKDFSTNESIFLKLKEDNFKPLENCYKFAEKHLKKNSKIDLNNSAAVACTVATFNNMLVILNLGNCKAVGFKSNGDYEVLNSVHDTINDNEMNRILKSGGVLRKNKNKLNIYDKNGKLPGEEFSRCIGFINCELPLEKIPEITIYDLESFLVEDENAKENRMEFMVIGNSIFWSGISYDQVFREVSNKYMKLDPSSIAKILVDKYIKVNSDVHF